MRMKGKSENFTSFLFMFSSCDKYLYKLALGQLDLIACK